jgi:hypothetical protein
MSRQVDDIDRSSRARGVAERSAHHGRAASLNALSALVMRAIAPSDERMTSHRRTESAMSNHRQLCPSAAGTSKFDFSAARDAKLTSNDTPKVQPVHVLEATPQLVWEPRRAMLLNLAASAGSQRAGDSPPTMPTSAMKPDRH